MITREAFLREEEEASMLNILLDHGPCAPDRDGGSSRRNNDSAFVTNENMCVVSDTNM